MRRDSGLAKWRDGVWWCSVIDVVAGRCRLVALAQAPHGFSMRNLVGVYIDHFEEENMYALVLICV